MSISEVSNGMATLLGPNEKLDFGTICSSLITTPYTNFNQAKLNKQYSSSEWSHRYDPNKVGQEHVNNTLSGTQKARAEIECHLNVPYGTSGLQQLDVYAPSSLPETAPVLFYIHGGYWHLLGREYSGFMASTFTAAGAVVVAIGYDLGKVVTMDERVSQVQKALKWTLKFAHERGSKGVYICGHSAGGHLTAMMLSIDWSTESPDHYLLLKGAAPVSGIFDLRPFVLHEDNEEVGLSMEMAWKNSPARLVEDIKKWSRNIEILVVVGEHDSPEFRRQSKEFTNVLKAEGPSVSLMDVPDVDHFNAIENLDNPNYIVTKALVKMMNLN